MPQLLQTEFLQWRRFCGCYKIIWIFVKALNWKPQACRVFAPSSWLIRCGEQWVVFSQVPEQRWTPRSGSDSFTSDSLLQNQGISQKEFQWLALWFAPYDSVQKMKHFGSMQMCCKFTMTAMWLLNYAESDKIRNNRLFRNSSASTYVKTATKMLREITVRRTYYHQI